MSKGSHLVAYDLCDPAGNITAIVSSYDLGTTRKRIVDYLILRERVAEQVGFVVLDDKNGRVPRIEMMGGEFSGNGLASAGLILLKELKQSELLLFSSGLAEPARIWLKDAKTGWGSKKGEYVNVNVSLSISAGQIEAAHVVGIQLEGITHYFYVCGNMLEATREKAEKIISSDRTENKAIGVIFVKYETGYFDIVPFVFVKDVNTFVQESACSSGSLALSLFWMKTKGIKPPISLYIRQPSGQTITATVNSSDMERINVSLEIPVRHLGTASLVIPG